MGMRVQRATGGRSSHGAGVDALADDTRHTPDAVANDPRGVRAGYDAAMDLTLPRAVDRIASLGAPQRRWVSRMSSEGAEAQIGSHERWIVTLVAGDGVELSARRPRERRDERLVQHLRTEADLDLFAHELGELMTWWADRLTVHSLVPGRLYCVCKAMADHCGNAFHAGEKLRFIERHFLPHDGGHTIFFGCPDGRERRMYLHEEDEREILDDLDSYLLDEPPAESHACG